MMIKAIPSPASSGGKMNLINLNTRAYIYRYLILLIMTQKKHSDKFRCVSFLIFVDFVTE